MVDVMVPVALDQTYSYRVPRGMELKAGDVVIQRGTNHGWANRSDRNCRIAFILIDGQFDADLA